MKFQAVAVLAVLSVAGCQDSHTASSMPGDRVAATPATFNTAGAPTLVLSIPNMHCESCVAKTTEVLSKQAGVVDVRVDLDTKQATVAVDEATFDGKAALAVLDDYGFTGSSILDEASRQGEESTDRNRSQGERSVPGKHPN